jgi:hypothetical protein
MTSHQLPVELQESDNQLRSLRKPHEPYLNDTVGDSESALEGESVIGLAVYAMLPWWLEGMAEGGGGDGNETKDYLIGTPLALVSMATYLSLNTQLEWWNIFAFSMMAATGTFLGLIVFHLIFHKCISMVIYNRLFRRDWMKKMRIADKQNYDEEVATYPQRVQDYEIARTKALTEANNALTAYQGSGNSKAYKIGDYGFEKISDLENVLNFAGNKARSLFGKIINR